MQLTCNVRWRNDDRIRLLCLIPGCLKEFPFYPIRIPFRFGFFRVVLRRHLLLLLLHSSHSFNNERSKNSPHPKDEESIAVPPLFAMIDGIIAHFIPITVFDRFCLLLFSKTAPGRPSIRTSREILQPRISLSVSFRIYSSHSKLSNLLLMMISLYCSLFMIDSSI